MTVEFRALATINKGKNKGKQKFWHNIYYNGEEVLMYSSYRGTWTQLKNVEAVDIFTGINDTNFKKVFERDIIRAENSIAWIEGSVIYNPFIGGFGIEIHTTFNYDIPDDNFVSFKKLIENGFVIKKIGNIYGVEENPKEWYEL